MSNLKEVTKDNTAKEKKMFMAQARFNYNDSEAGALEIGFAFKPGMAYKDFMEQCDRAFGHMRFAFNDPELFDELTKAEGLDG